MPECPVCTIVKNACEKLGDRKYCEEIINDLNNGRISEKEFVDRLSKKFGPAFLKEFDKEAKS